MSSGCRFVILGEDEAHLRFARRFLIERGLVESNREITDIPIPAGQGAGDQFVRQRLPVELEAIRGVASFQRKLLLVVTDADQLECLERRRQLTTACDEAGLDPIRENDPVAIFLPRRNIETWFAFLLLGMPVDELRDYKNIAAEESPRKAAKELAERCRGKALGGMPPPSLQSACAEFERVTRNL